MTAARLKKYRMLICTAFAGKILKYIFNLSLILSFPCVPAAICSFNTGISIGWAGPVIGKTSDPNGTFYITRDEVKWIGSLQPVGQFIGAPLGYYLTDNWGRSKAVVSTSLPFGTSYVLFAFWQQIYPYYVARVINGIGTGISLAVTMIYISEIAPAKIRGVLGLTSSVSLAFGSFVCYIIIPFMPLKSSNVLFILLSIAQFIAGIFIIETPHFLLLKNRDVDAKEALQKLRGADEVNDEFFHIKKHIEIQQKDKVSINQLWKNKIYRRGLMLACLAILAQHFTGFFGMLNFSQLIFKMQGTDFMSADMSGIIFGFTKFAGFLLSAVVVDHVGRKKLLSASSGLSAIPLAVLGMYVYLHGIGYDLSNWSFVPLLAMVTHMTVYSVGLGALVFLYMAEVLPTNVRAMGGAVIIIFGAILASTVTQLFSELAKIREDIPFWFFSVTTFIGCLLQIAFLIETKARHFSDIEKMLS